MRIARFILLSFFLWPLSVHAEEEQLTRREGFLVLWRSIQRPAHETELSTPFTDVEEGEPGFVELTYAKRRKILDDARAFHPDGPLLLRDALLWLYRTRNVREITLMQREHMRSLMREFHLSLSSVGERVGVRGIEDYLDKPVSKDQLRDLMFQLDTFLREQVHEVSYYAEDFHGRGTAFGEPFDMHALTAAHRSLPHNTLVKVTNVENGREVVVRINDRGPYVDGRDMDLSLAAFERLAPRGSGVIRATFQRLGDGDVNSSCSSGLAQRYQKRITRDVRFHQGIPHVFALGKTLWLGANKHFVVHTVTYPDGNQNRFQDFVYPKERFTFRPAVQGEYVFEVGTPFGRKREMRMRVVACGV